MPIPGTRPAPAPRRRLGRALIVLGLVVAGAACGNDNADRAAELTTARADPTVDGRVTVTGSSTVGPMSMVAAEAFRGQNRRVAVSVESPGTGDGFERFCAGEADVTGASRPISDDERSACAAAGIEVLELPVARDGISIITAHDNRVGCLSFADLYALLGPEATAGRWREAQPLAAELGSDTTFPDARLVVTGPGQESGTYDSLVEQVLEPLIEERLAAGHLDPTTAASGTRLDYAASPNDNTIIEGVGSDPGGLGWVSFTYAQGVDHVRSVPVATAPGQDCVTPSRETVQDGSYPIARTLYLYVDGGRAGSRPAVAAFVDFYLAGLADFVRLADFVPLADPGAAADIWDPPA